MAGRSGTIWSMVAAGLTLVTIGMMIVTGGAAGQEIEFIPLDARLEMTNMALGTGVVEDHYLITVVSTENAGRGARRFYLSGQGGLSGAIR